MRVFKGAKGRITRAVGIEPEVSGEDARGSVLAIGNFDGVHKGHKALLQQAMAEAARRSVQAGVMVFEPHPREFFQPDTPHFRLTPLAEKLRLFEEIGLDLAIVLDFDADFAALTAKDFIADILVAELGVAQVIVGYDFNFGHKRAGTPETLERAGRELVFDVSVVTAQGDGAARYSSSAIRAALVGGDIAAATDALGHFWRVRGRVVSGTKLGRELGFPTANIVLEPGVRLAHGIYAAQVVVGQETYDGAAYFGTRPSVEADGDVVLEVFLMDFEGDLYEQELAISFVAHLRNDAAFDDLAALKEQIAKDCVSAGNALRAAGV